MKMKPYILLVHPLYGEETESRIFHPGFELPISLAYISAYIEQKGIENDILDLRLEIDPEQALRSKIHEKRPLAIGITSSTAGIENAASIASVIKEADNRIVTVLGGWHASALPAETLMKYSQFDYIIHGEGEVAFANLIASLEGGGHPEGVKGVALRVNGGVQVNPREELLSNLDEIPLPARHKLPVFRYQPQPGTRNYLTLPSTGILVGRGCPYGCLFCYKGVWGKSVRFRTPENVLAEIEMCIKKFGIRDFRFYDDTITFPKWDLKHFCEEIIKRKYNISWNCWSRVNDVDEDKLRLMKAAGCYHIKFGIEFGTEKALKLARKGATLDQAREAVSMCKKVDIECKGSFVFGIPGETLEDCRNTLSFALEVAPHFATFYAFDPIPGSPFYQQIKDGKIDPEKDIIDRRVTLSFANNAYRVFYFRPTFIIQRITSFMRHPVKEGFMTLSGIRMIISYWLHKLGKSAVS